MTDDLSRKDKEAIRNIERFSGKVYSDRVDVIRTAMIKPNTFLQGGTVEIMHS